MYLQRVKKRLVCSFQSCAGLCKTEEERKKSSSSSSSENEDQVEGEVDEEKEDKVTVVDGTTTSRKVSYHRLEPAPEPELVAEPVAEQVAATEEKPESL